VASAPRKSVSGVLPDSPLQSKTDFFVDKVAAHD
jgi:hypothetical protein